MKLENCEARQPSQAPGTERLAPTIEEQRAFAYSSQQGYDKNNQHLVDNGLLTNLAIFQSSDSPAPGQTGVFLDYGTQQIGEQRYALGVDCEDSPVAFTDKLLSFSQAAAARALDAKSYTTWSNEEKEKFLGIGEGLNDAKEKTKAAASAIGHAFVDGEFLHFMAQPNALNKPLFSVLGQALDAAAQNPNALNIAVGTAVLKGSERYSKMDSRGQGHMIGETMFGFINPEGSTEGLETALRAADKVATHVDAKVMNVIDASTQAIDKGRLVLPELTQKAHAGLDQLMAGPRQELVPAFAGGNPNQIVERIPIVAKDENFFAMMKAGDSRNGIQKGIDAAGNEFKWQTDRYTGRLQKIENGEVRQAYTWSVINERFDETCVRQSHEGSCVSAVGEMLTGGKNSEAQFLTRLDIPGSIPDLAEALANFTDSVWTNKVAGKPLRELLKDGPIGVLLMEYQRTPHAVIVDRILENGNCLIRDPLEGTSYEMTFKEFDKHWMEQAAFRKPQ